MKTLFVISSCVSKHSGGRGTTSLARLSNHIHLKFQHYIFSLLSSTKL